MQQAGPFAAAQIDRPQRRSDPPPINAPRPFWGLVESRADNGRLQERVAREESLIQGALWDRHRQIEALLGRPVPRSASMSGAGSGSLTDDQYERRLEELRREFPEQMAGVESRSDLAARLAGQPSVYRYDTAYGPAWVRTLQNGSLWLETADGRTGPLSSFPGARPVRRQGEPDIPTDRYGSSVTAATRSLGERFTSTWDDAARRNPLMALARAVLPDEDVFLGTDAAGNPVYERSLRDRVAAEERERRDSYELLSSADAWDAGDGSLLSKLVRGAATLGGAVAGAASDPVNVLAPGRTVAGRIVGSAAVNAAGDAATQGADVAAGVEDRFSASQVALAASLGVVLQGGMEGGAAVTRALSGDPGGVVGAVAREIDRSSRQIIGEPLPPVVRAAASRVEGDALDRQRAGLADGQTRREVASALGSSRPASVPPERDLPEIFDTGVTAGTEPLREVDYQGRRVAEGRFDPLAVEVDPARFAFDRPAPSADLSNVSAWDGAAAGRVILWQDRAGTTYVVDGQARAGLARRLAEAQADPDVMLDGYLLRRAEGWTAEDARVVAALTNLREGAGTVLDAARLLRETPGYASDRSLPVAGPFIREARALAQLQSDAFAAVARGDVAADHAVAVGQLASDRPDLHGSMVDLMARARVRDVDEARALVMEVRHADAFAAYGLFGETAGDDLLIARARLRAAVLKALRREPGLYSSLSRQAELLEGAGAAVGRSADEAVLARDMAVSAAVERMGVTGAGEDAFSAAARGLLAKPRSMKSGVERVLTDLRTAVQAVEDAEAERALLLDPDAPSAASDRALGGFDQPGGPGQARQIEPKPEDAQAEAAAAEQWGDLPEVGDEDRAIEVLRVCAPGA